MERAKQGPAIPASLVNEMATLSPEAWESVIRSVDTVFAILMAGENLFLDRRTCGEEIGSRIDQIEGNLAEITTGEWRRELVFALTLLNALKKHFTGLQDDEAE